MFTSLWHTKANIFIESLAVITMTQTHMLIAQTRKSDRPRCELTVKKIDEDLKAKHLELQLFLRDSIESK